MQVSQKTRYGIRAITYLAIHHNKEKVPIQQIAEEENISKRYLELIFVELKKAGLVLSIKGAAGGYYLAKEPENITASEIASIFEGGLEVINDTEEFSPDKIGYTIVNSVWNKLSNSFKKELASITIDKLVKDYKDNLSDGYIYYI